MNQHLLQGKQDDELQESKCIIPPYLYTVELADEVLSVVAEWTQLSPQLLNLVQEILHRFLHLFPGITGQRAQQVGGRLAMVMVVAVQDAGEDASVDVQSGV